MKIPGILKKKLFWSVLILKLMLGTIFGSDVLVKGFVPFINYYVNSGLSNPYDFFIAIGNTTAFPYPSVMLWLSGLPAFVSGLFYSGNYTVVSQVHLLLTRIPLIIADITILLVLQSMLKVKDKQVLYYYWCSPILIYISYIHGQLDAIPIALLFVSLYLLFRNRLFWAFMVLGLGLAAKTNIIIAAPFMALYLWKRYRSLVPVVKCAFVTLISYFAVLLPYLFSAGMYQMVFKSPEQVKAFELSVPLIPGVLEILLVPFVLVGLFFWISQQKRLNQDMLMMNLSLVFAVFVILVPPRPGWFYWSIPFIIFFYIKQDVVPKAVYWAINLFYFLFFFTSPQGDLFKVFQVSSASIATIPNLYNLLLQAGYNAQLINNIFFSFLVGAMSITAYWIYKIGIKSSKEYKVKERPFITGIGGDSGSGKTTLAKLLSRIVGYKQTVFLEGDDVHKWERGHKNWKRWTHLNPKGNMLHLDMQHAGALRGGKEIYRAFYDHNTGSFTSPNDIKANKFMFHVGLHPFYLNKMRNLQDLKIFLDPQESLRCYWKIRRDKAKRGYDEKKVLEQLKARENDSKKYIHPQKQFADAVISFKTRSDPSQKLELHEMGLYLEIILNNSFSLEPWDEAAKNTRYLSFKYEYNDDLRTQTATFEGRISKEEVERLAYTMIPNLRDLVFGEPKFEKGYNGIIQVIYLYLLSEVSRDRSTDDEI